MASPPSPVGLIGVAPARGAALRAAGVETLAGDAALAGRCGVVMVAGPMEERAERVREVIARGANVFAEWPPAPDLDGARALAAVAEEAGVEVGVSHPLPIDGLLARRPDGWRARLVTLSLTASADGALASISPEQRLAGALDLCASLVGTRGLADLDAEAVGWPDADDGPGTLALSLRFRTGAFATVALRNGADGDALSLLATGAAGTVEAHALDADSAPDPVLAFLDALATNRRAPFSLYDAVGTLRMAARVANRLG